MFKVNQYFDGNVASLAFKTTDGNATAGVMASGEYEFGTGTEEIMIVTTGSMKVLLPGSKDWVIYGVGGSYKVSANSKFKVSVDSDTSYICLYK